MLAWSVEKIAFFSLNWGKIYDLWEEMAEFIGGKYQNVGCPIFLFPKILSYVKIIIPINENPTHQRKNKATKA